MTNDEYYSLPAGVGPALLMKYGSGGIASIPFVGYQAYLDPAPLPPAPEVAPLIPPTSTIQPVATITTIPPPSNRITLLSPDGRTQKVVGTLEALHGSLAEGWNVLRDNGSSATVQMFRGGYLVDGHPLNVVLGQGWITGQREAIAQAVAAGQVPPPYLMLTAPELAPPADNFLGAALGLDSETILYAGGAAVVLLLFFSSKGRKRKNG